MNANILSLSAAQACYWFSVLVGISLSSVIGAELAPTARLATLPYTLISASALLVTFGLSRFIGRYGWRIVLRGGALAGVAAALLSVWAVLHSNFALFCLASTLMGIYQASSAYYRLAALAYAPDAQQGAAVGWVLSGSLAAAFFGPTIASATSHWFATSSYAGPYLLTAVFSVLAIVAIQCLPADAAKQPAAHKQNEARAFNRQPLYWLGTLNTAFAQGVMILMMIVAPLSMHHGCHYPVSSGVSVIGWHIVGMFLPSFFSGKLIDRFGAASVILAGLGLLLASAFAAIQGTTLSNYYLSLFLLGTGWNLVYVAGTWQYNHALQETEKSRAQGQAEFLIALAAVTGAGFGGWLHSLFDWQVLNRGVLIAVLAMAVVNLLSWKFRASVSANPPAA
ncbi:MAG: MFS transporter [Gammaproteobacteria bacterium]|nr:MFS transporter [Gammaproteobacteria bacterium]